MGARGRKSAAELSIIAGQIDSVDRPDAPYDLTDEQAEEWRAIVDRMPADWFQRETYPLLAQYCRHIVSSRHVAKLIYDLEKKKGGFDVVDYDRLLKMQEREGRAASSLATRMRITQQTTYDKSKKKPPQSGKLWEAED